MSTKSKKEFRIVLGEGHETRAGLATLEREYIKHVLEQSKWNKSKTAINLGVSRGTLNTKLKEYFGDTYVNSKEL